MQRIFTGFCWNRYRRFCCFWLHGSISRQLRPRATIDDGSCQYRDTGDDLPPPPPPWPPKNWWIWVLALFGAGLIAVLIYMTMIRENFDRKELDELVKSGKYEEALEYIEKHPSDEVKEEEINRIEDLEELSKI